MIGTKTVFVLGAGASKPFGLPLGSELYHAVLNSSGPQAENGKLLLDCTHYTAPEIKDFLNALKYSGLTSVDAFLERRPSYLGVGKACMAAELIKRENFQQLWIPAGNWMLYLYSKMVGASLKDFGDNAVSFITFNYDRSLEQFLFTSLLNSFGEPPNKCADVLSRLPIIHLHGRLAHLPWQGQSESIAYGDKNINADSMRVFCEEIKVVHEDITGRDEEFSNAKRILREAERVYLMGFGFGKANVERLGLANLHPPRGYYASAFGMVGQEIEDTRAQCGGGISLGNQHSDCLASFRQYVEWS